jgi:hypothetical protein
MQLRSTLSWTLMALLPVGVLAPGCSEQLASKGQLITCTTDPGTDVILRCEPGDGAGSNTCQDIDEDGDGEPHEARWLGRASVARSSGSGPAERRRPGERQRRWPFTSSQLRPPPVDLARRYRGAGGRSDDRDRAADRSCRLGSWRCGIGARRS